MKNNSNDEKLNLFKEISVFTNYLCILTGSLALIILKEIEERECGDLDIVIPYYFDFSKFGKCNIIENYSKPTLIEIENSVCKVHVLIDNNCVYKQILDPNLNIKISNSDDIWIAKFKSYIKYGSEKNRIDLENMFKLKNERKNNAALEDILLF